MGSFLTPVLHRHPNADVRQVCQAPKVTTTTDFEIELATELDTLLDASARRPCVRLRETSPGSGPGRYRVTDDLAKWVENIGPGPILLHVDMDYFNNRYDGDGDWRERTAILDPGPDEVLAQVDRLTSTLREANLVSRIEDAVIAFSPGFFPAGRC
jgi:hypothetical protein